MTATPRCELYINTSPYQHPNIQVTLKKHMCRSWCPDATRERPYTHYTHIERMMNDQYCVNDRKTYCERFIHTWATQHPKTKVTFMKRICRSRCPVATREHPYTQYTPIERMMSDQLCVNDRQTQPWTIYSHLSHSTSEHSSDFYEAYICRSRCPVATRGHPYT